VRRLKFFIVVFASLIVLIFMIKYLSLPFLKAVLKSKYDITLSFSVLSASDIDTFAVKDLVIEKSNHFKISIETLAFSPDRSTDSVFRSNWILKNLFIENLYLELYEPFFEKKGDSQPFELPYFPLKQTKIINGGAIIHLKDRDIELQNINISGFKEYEIDVEKIEHRDKRGGLDPITGTLSATLFASKFDYALKRLDFSSDFFVFNGKTEKSEERCFEGGFFINGKKALNFLDINGTGNIEGELSCVREKGSAPYISGSLKGSNVAILLDDRKLDFWDFFSDFNIHSDRLLINNFTIFNKNNPVATIEASSIFAEKKIEGHAHIMDIGFENILNRMGETTTVEFFPRGTVEFSNPYDRFDLKMTGTLRLSGFEVEDDGYILDLKDSYDITVEGNILPDRAILNKGTVISSDRTSRADVGKSWFDFKSKFSINVLPSSRVDVTKIGKIANIQVGGFGLIEGKISSLYENPLIKGRVRLKNCLVDFAHLDSCEGDVSLRNMILAFDVKDSAFGNSTGSNANVAIDFKKGLINFSANNISGRVKDFGKLLKRKIPIDGDYSFSGKGAYSDIYGKGNLDLLNFYLSGGNLYYKKALLADKVNIHIVTKKDQFHLDNSYIHYKKSSIKLTGHIDQNRESEIQGELSSFFPEDFPIFKNISFIAPRMGIKLTGKIENPQIKGNFFLGKVSYEKINLGNLSLSAVMNTGEQFLSAKGNLGDAFSFEGEMMNFSIKKLNASIKANRFETNFDDMIVKLSGRTEIKSGIVDAKLEMLQIEAPDLDLKNSDPLIISGPMDALSVKKTDFSGNFGTLSLSGDIIQGEPYLDISGEIKPLLLQPYFSDGVSDIAGKAFFDLSLKKSELFGKMKIKDISFNIDELNLPVSGINGNILFKRDEWEIPGINGVIGDGTIRIFGKGNMFPEPEGEIKLAISNAYAKNKNLGQFSFSTDLAISLGLDETPTVSGDIELKNIMYRRDISIESEIVKTILSSGKESLDRKDSDEEAVRFNLHVTGRNNIKIRTNLLKTDLDFDTYIFGDSNNIGLSGIINLREGKLVFKQNEFEIERGIIQLETEEEVMAYLDIEATNRALVAPRKDNLESIEVAAAPSKKEEYKLILNIFGHAEDPQIKLRSIPYLEQTDIYSILLWGEFFDIYSSNINIRNIAISAVTDIIGINTAVKENFKLTSFELKSMYSETLAKTVIKIEAVKELYPFLFLTFLSNPVNSNDQSVELKYKGKKLDFNVNWKSENDAENDFGSIGFDIRLNYVFE